MTKKPLVFIGSSFESVDTARKVQMSLDRVAKKQVVSTVWDQGVVRLGEHTLDGLFRELNNSDFGVFVFAPDDLLKLRRESYWSARDNVIFEFGLFMGKLGRDRSFMLVPDNLPDDLKMRIPTDLSGVTYAEYAVEWLEENPRRALDTACAQLWWEIRDRHGNSRKEEVPPKKPPSVLVETPAEPSEDQEDTCKKDKRVRTEITSTQELLSRDTSDLYYLLFKDVVNCEKTRKTIREIGEELQKRRGPESSFRLAGMYDIMGNWDILVRLRLDKAAGINPIKERIAEELERRNLKVRRRILPIDVQIETDIKSGFSVLPTEIKHFRMGSTAEYESARCQRAFLYIMVPNPNEIEAFAVRLLDTLRSDKKQAVAAIVESVSVGSHEIILEIFMTCSQTPVISLLNREIEALLPDFGVVQKYTLTCFDYDERDL